MVHELDIAEALGLDLEAVVDTPSGRRVLDEMLMLLPRGAAKGGAAEGEIVAVDIGPPLPRCGRRAGGGRAGACPPTPARERRRCTFAPPPPCSFAWPPAAATPPRRSPAVTSTVDGDEELAARVLTAINVIP